MDDTDTVSTEAEITSVDPLNLALTAKSTQSRASWWIVTVGLILAMIGSIAGVVDTFNKRDTKFVIRLSHKRIPFPAVTFCNMNPYKKSALAMVPQVAGLLESYNAAASDSKTKNAATTGDDSERVRVKRATNPCGCSNASSVTGYNPGLSSSIFELFPAVYQNWSCGFECCKLYAPPGRSGRLAHLIGDTLFTYLASVGVIQTIDNSNTANEAWIGLFGYRSEYPSYYWYDDVGVKRQGVGAVRAPSLCASNNTCRAIVSWWVSGDYPVVIWNDINTGYITYDNWQPYKGRRIICEYYYPTTTTTTTTSTTSTTSSTTTYTTSTTTTTSSTSTTSSSSTTPPSTSTLTTPTATTSGPTTTMVTTTPGVSTTPTSPASTASSTATATSPSISVSSSSVPTSASGASTTATATSAPTSAASTSALGTSIRSTLPAVTTTSPSIISSTAQPSSASTASTMTSDTASVRPTTVAQLTSAQTAPTTLPAVTTSSIPTVTTPAILVTAATSIPQSSSVSIPASATTVLASSASTSGSPSPSTVTTAVTATATGSTLSSSTLPASSSLSIPTMSAPPSTSLAVTSISSIPPSAVTSTISAASVSTIAQTLPTSFSATANPAAPVSSGASPTLSSQSLFTATSALSTQSTALSTGEPSTPGVSSTSPTAASTQSSTSGSISSAASASSSSSSARSTPAASTAAPSIASSPPITVQTSIAPSSGTTSIVNPATTASAAPAASSSSVATPVVSSSPPVTSAMLSATPTSQRSTVVAVTTISPGASSSSGYTSAFVASSAALAISESSSILPVTSSASTAVSPSQYTQRISASSSTAGLVSTSAAVSTALSGATAAATIATSQISAGVPSSARTSRSAVPSFMTQPTSQTGAATTVTGGSTTSSAVSSPVASSAAATVSSIATLGTSSASQQTFVTSGIPADTTSTPSVGTTRLMFQTSSKHADTSAVVTGPVTSFSSQQTPISSVATAPATVDWAPSQTTISSRQTSSSSAGTTPSYSTLATASASPSAKTTTASAHQTTAPEVIIFSPAKTSSSEDVTSASSLISSELPSTFASSQLQAAADSTTMLAASTKAAPDVTVARTSTSATVEKTSVIDAAVTSSLSQQPYPNSTTAAGFSSSSRPSSFFTELSQAMSDTTMPNTELIPQSTVPVTQSSHNQASATAALTPAVGSSETAIATSTGLSGVSELSSAVLQTVPSTIPNIVTSSAKILEGQTAPSSANTAALGTQNITSSIIVASEATSLSSELSLDSEISKPPGPVPSAATSTMRSGSFMIAATTVPKSLSNAPITSTIIDDITKATSPSIPFNTARSTLLSSFPGVVSTATVISTMAIIQPAPSTDFALGNDKTSSRIMALTAGGVGPSLTLDNGTIITTAMPDGTISTIPPANDALFSTSASLALSATEAQVSTPIYLNATNINPTSTLSPRPRSSKSFKQQASQNSNASALAEQTTKTVALRPDVAALSPTSSALNLPALDGPYVPSVVTSSFSVTSQFPKSDNLSTVRSSAQSDNMSPSDFHVSFPTSRAISQDQKIPQDVTDPARVLDAESTASSSAHPSSKPLPMTTATWLPSMAPDMVNPGKKSNTTDAPLLKRTKTTPPATIRPVGTPFVANVFSTKDSPNRVGPPFVPPDPELSTTESNIPIDQAIMPEDPPKEIESLMDGTDNQNAPFLTAPDGYASPQIASDNSKKTSPTKVPALQRRTKTTGDPKLKGSPISTQNDPPPSNSGTAAPPGQPKAPTMSTSKTFKYSARFKLGASKSSMTASPISSTPENFSAAVANPDASTIGMAQNASMPDQRTSPSAMPNAKTSVSAATSSDIRKVVDPMLQPVKFDQIALAATSEDILGYITASLPEELAIKAGYNISEMLIRCTYDGAGCRISDFKLKRDPNYGNCYTFNADGHFMLASRPGTERGLSVVFTVGEDQYLDFVQSAGFRIVLHGQNESVFPDALGFYAPDSYQSSFSVKMQTVSSTSSAQKPCANSMQEVPVFNYLNDTYSKEGCLRSCYQNSVIQRCHCGDPRIPLPAAPSKAGHCDVINRTCVNSYYSIDDSEMRKNCFCPPTCHNDVFDTTVSTTRWSLSQGKNGEKVVSNAQSSYQPNTRMVRIDVYFETTMITSYVEAPVYDILSLLWDIASISGLFLGASVLSVFELLNLTSYLMKKFH